VSTPEWAPTRDPRLARPNGTPHTPPQPRARPPAEKETKRLEKEHRRNANKLAGDEDDIDAILAAMAMEDKKKETVQYERGVPAPSPRVNASLLARSTGEGRSQRHELVMYGGEFYNQLLDKTYVYGDVFLYDVKERQWTRVVIPGGPQARSAHQAVLYKGFMYVFGGEFTSPNQTKFHHFRDLWKLDCETHRWAQIGSKGGPSARSGHRMAVWKDKIVLFGGYYDTGLELKYYNDLWVFDMAVNKWESVGDPGSGPSPRSACQVKVYGDTMFLYGGYYRSPDVEDEEIERAKVHQDMWALDLKTYRWEKVPRQGMGPGPRSGFSMVQHKRRAVLFGGVSDRDAGRDGDLIVSEFYNETYNFTFEARRWFPLDIRPPRPDQGQKRGRRAKKGRGDGDEGRGDGDDAGAGDDVGAGAGDTAQDRAATRIQAKFRGYVVRKAYLTYRVGGVVSELLYSPASYGVDPGSKDYPKPRARINAMMAVAGGDLWIYGGIVEVGNGEKTREVTLDDLWRVNLDKCDGWEVVMDTTVGPEVFNDGGTSDDTDIESVDGGDAQPKWNA